MKQATIDQIALGAARCAEEIIVEEHPGGAAQRQAKLQAMFAEWIEHAVNREVRNARRRVERWRA
ncbi:hypothetical protein HNR00_003095 [Methylorubrum rhodinum]|uniref:Uncharacterized protein n=1 Tax=Methylorubrum rhodinum TaxID=29428 RepID=A0A840ZMT8_9HYPH|nr:hypothetical protein [Methylorubrum rhodinum]MBB5758375.1 hypothetical protein [Methylorubrum rhodinum]